MLTLEQAKLMALKLIREYGVNGRTGRNFRIGCNSCGDLYVRVRTGEIRPLRLDPEQPDYYETAHEFTIDPATYCVANQRTVPWSCKTMREHWYESLEDQQGDEVKAALISFQDTGLWHYHRSLDELNQEFCRWAESVDPLVF